MLWGQDAVVAKPSRVRLGGFSVGAGVGYGQGFGYGGYGYRPLFYDPWSYYGYGYYPGYFGGYGRGPNMGEVKLSGISRDAQVFLNGGFAGDGHHLKNIWLQPGKYTLEVRDNGGSYSKTVYVLSGKTIKIEPVFTGTRGPRS